MINKPNLIKEETAFAAKNYPQVSGATSKLLKVLKKEATEIFEARQNRPRDTPGLSRDQVDEIRNSLLADIDSPVVLPKINPIEPLDIKGELPDVAPTDIPAHADNPKFEMTDPNVSKAIGSEFLEKIDEPAPDPVAEKRTEKRNINIQRHHQGALANMPDPSVTLENMKTAEDISKLLDITAEQLNMTDVRTHKEIEAATKDTKQVLELLKPVFEGTQNGLLNDRQLHAGRKILTTLGDELAVIAKDVNSGNQTPERLLQFNQKMELWTSMQAYMQGQVSEVAKALSQQNMIAKTLDSGSAQDMITAMHTAGASRETIIKQADILSREIEKSNNVIDGVAKSMRPLRHTAMGASVEFWKNNILSGPSTHNINIISNSAVQMYEALLIKPVAAAVGTVRRGITGDTDGVTGTEAMVNIVSSMNGIHMGMKGFVKALISGEGQFGGDKAEFHSQTYELARRMGASDTMSEAIQFGTSLSFRALQAEDELFKTNAFMMELSSLATRDSMQKGLKGDEFFDNMEKILNDPPDDIYEASIKKAKTVTFTDEQVGGFLGDLANSAKKMSANHPWFGYLVPFINTPTNLVKYSINNSVFSVVAPDIWKAYQKGGAERDIATARVITAFGATFAMWQAYESGMVTGQESQDWDLNSVRDLAGERPESIVIGEGEDAQYIEVGRLDPMTQSLFTVINAIEASKYADGEAGASEAMLYGVSEMAKHTFDSTYMKSMGDVIDVLNGNKNPADIPANIMSGFIPYVGMLKAARKYSDTDRRKFLKGIHDNNFSSRAGHKMKESLPEGLLDIMGLERSGAFARYWDGTKKTPRMGEALYAMSPVKVSGVPGHGDAVNTQLMRNGIGPSDPDDIFTILGGGGVQISLKDIDKTGEMYDKYYVYVGKMRREFLTDLISKPGYRKLGDDGPKSLKSIQLSSTLNRANEYARNKFMTEQLPKLIKAEVKKNPDNVQAVELAKGLDKYAKKAVKGEMTELKDFFRVKKEAGEAHKDPVHF